MTTIEQPQGKNTVISKGESRMFGFSLAWWNIFMLWSLGLAAVAAVAVLATTRVVIVLQDREAKASAERIALLENSTTSLRGKNIELQTNFEKERAERLRLEAKVSPRILDPHRLASLLGTSVSGIDIDIVAYDAMGADVTPLSQDIGAAIGLAHGNAKLFVPFGGAGTAKGILVRTEDGASAKLEAAATTLVSAFNKLGLTSAKWNSFPANEPPAGAYNGPGEAKAKLRILVGAKI